MTNVCCCMYRCTLALHTGNTKLNTLCSTHSHKAAKTASHNLRKLNLQRVTLIHAAEDEHLASLTEKTKRNPQGQMLRRRGLAQVRNQLLFRSELQDPQLQSFFLIEVASVLYASGGAKAAADQFTTANKLPSAVYDVA